MRALRTFLPEIAYSILALLLVLLWILHARLSAASVAMKGRRRTIHLPGPRPSKFVSAAIQLSDPRPVHRSERIVAQEVPFGSTSAP